MSDADWPLTTESIARTLDEVRRTPCGQSAYCPDDESAVRFHLHVIAEKALSELLGHRTARAAGADRVRSVVREAFGEDPSRESLWPRVEAIATHAAEQLTGVGVGLSAEELALLHQMRDSQASALASIGHLSDDVSVNLNRKIALLNRLLASQPATDYRAAICAPATPVIAARDPASLTEDEIRVARTAARADQEELIGVVHSCSDVLRYGDRMGPEVEVASRRRIRDYVASKKTVPAAAITALLDSDMPAGELRKALAEIVGLK